MKLKSNIAKALNAQVHQELTASYHYLAMAAYFEVQSLPGFAAWFREQSAEETMHGMKIYDHIILREGEVKLEDIQALNKAFQTPEEVVKIALEMEKSVTANIHSIHALATKESDPGTQSLMNWFVTEQVEEEETFRDLLERVSAAENNRWFLLQLDSEMKSRSADA